MPKKSRHPLYVQISEGVGRRLRLYAVSEGKNIQDVVEEQLDRGLPRMSVRKTAKLPSTAGAR